MLLSDVHLKLNEMMGTLTSAFHEKGMEDFFNTPDCIKQNLKISEKEIQDLEQEAISFFKEKEWDRALEVLQFLMFFEPMNPFHFLRSGIVFLQKKEHKKALQILTLGSLWAPENPKFLLYMGACHRALGDADRAKEAFEACVELSKNESEYKEVFFLAKDALAEGGK